jgi:hypothetical protein
MGRSKQEPRRERARAAHPARGAAARRAGGLRTARSIHGQPTPLQAARSRQRSVWRGSEAAVEAVCISPWLMKVAKPQGMLTRCTVSSARPIPRNRICACWPIASPSWSASWPMRTAIWRPAERPSAPGKASFCSTPFAGDLRNWRSARRGDRGGDRPEAPASGPASRTRGGRRRIRAAQALRSADSRRLGWCGEPRRRGRDAGRYAPRRPARARRRSGRRCGRASAPDDLRTSRTSRPTRDCDRTRPRCRPRTVC